MAEPDEGAQLLVKNCIYRIQSSKQKDREQLFGELREALSKPDISEGNLKKACRILGYTLPRYQNNKSRRLVQNLIILLAKLQPQPTVKYITQLLMDYTRESRNIVSTPNTSRVALTALTWSCLLLRYGIQDAKQCSGPVFDGLLAAQAVLLSQVVASGVPRHVAKASKLLSMTWEAIPGSVECYAERIAKEEPPTSHLIVFSSHLLKHLAEKKQHDVIAKYKAGYLDAFIKMCISCKAKPQLYVVEDAKLLLRHATHEEFAQSLLPAMQKAMLRNPEIILESVGHVLNGVSLDLSRYALDIGKTLATSLYSKEELTRQEAVQAFQFLARQCTEGSAILDVLQHLFGVLNGSEGKLTLAAQKMSVLDGIGMMSYNSVAANSLQNLSSGVAMQFKKVLESEVHEGTLVKALEVWALWCTKFSQQVPAVVIDWFKKGPTLKASTAAVRNAYIQCMSAAFSGNTVGQGVELFPFLISTVEKTGNQATQIPVVTESLSAVNLLLKLSAGNPECDAKLQSLWKMLLDPEKLVFVSEKFLASASDDALLQVVVLYDYLLRNRGHVLKGKVSSMHRATLFCLTRPEATLRRQCHAVVRKLVCSAGGADIARALLDEMASFQETLKVKRAVNGDGVGGDGGKEEVGGELHPCVLAECVTTLCSAGGVMDALQAEEVALESIIPAHHPAIKLIHNNLWIKMVKHLKQDPVQLVHKHHDQIVTKFVNNYRPTPVMENVVATLVSLNPDQMSLSVVQSVEAMMLDPGFQHVSRDDYFVYLTPSGQLYDKSVIESANQDSLLNMKNIKRESKAYSYKEQMEELQLRKELEDKKRKGKKASELTPKQKEAMKLQLEKEAATKKRVGELHEKVVHALSMLRATCCGSDIALAPHLPRILDIIVRNLSSPIAASELSKLYISLSKCVFDADEEFIGLAVGHTTLRLLQPQCDLDPSWCGEDLDRAVGRIVTLIHKHTMFTRTRTISSEETSDLDLRQPLTAPAFCYCFPFLRTAVLRNASKNESLSMTVLHLISDHLKMRGNEEDEMEAMVDLFHPRFLPRKQVLDLAVELIGSTTGRVQQMAVVVLLGAADAGSGKLGCAVATKQEIRCLMTATQHENAAVRDAALRGLASFVAMISGTEDHPDMAQDLVHRIWVSRFDVSPENREVANELWEAAQLEIYPALWEDLLSDVVHPIEPVRQAAAEALAEAVSQALTNKKHKDMPSLLLDRLLDIYQDKLTVLPPKMDNFGRVVEEAVDHWEPRSGVALALCKIAPHFNKAMVAKLIGFMVPAGLGDNSAEVRKNMLEAALAVVERHGKQSVNALLGVFEGFLDEAPDSRSYDTVRQSVVVLMGCLARHLEKDDARIQPILSKLLSVLETPSQQVQEAVANCLPALVPSIKDQAPQLIQKLLRQLLDSDSYGERKGAAYGLAGIVRGLGILSLKEHNIMNTLTESVQDKKSYRHREGALFAFEMLCNMLGKLFEPYVIHVLPHLLLCFGDSSQYVREATEDTAKAVMSKLSAHGVKLVLPSLLTGLEEESWRTKTGSVELLGNMAYCAPKQLSSCLPSIVPKLIEVLSDSHVKVQKAGAQALKLIGSVIRNPEIQAIVPDLLDALQNPAKKTASCLQILLDTQFVHFIDAPSLALIMPVVQRAFQDRSTETRKMAAQIIGNMYSLTDQKDLAPYLPTIMPGLQSSLLDPVPEVRSVSARALGAMARGMGESSFQEVLPWLMQMLTSESSAVDRSGAAQGLSEVVGGLGVDKLHRLMPEIISTTERTDIAPHVKDGYIMMFIYMPVVFQKDFTPYIGKIINPILKALSDENEFVRDTAMKAGQRIVNMYADSAITLLLPELERGLFDDNWRIRYSSVQLLGDLLYRISGVTGKMSTETANEDDNFGTEQSHRAIITSLGGVRRNHVLAGLYMGRSDVALLVRQAALHVWKVVVTNTPRTLREILPTLFELLLGCLASTSYDKRQVAARTLGDLVRKLGERVLPEIIPILERGLESEQADQRQGVCIGLSEIMAATSREMVMSFVDSLVPTVRRALCDPLPEVRQAAAKTFDSLHNTVGTRALDDILPDMLQQLNDPEMAEYALDGLRQVMAIKSRVVLPYLVPQLVAPPCNTRALSILASVAGEALTRHLSKILPALLSALQRAQGTPRETQELEYCQAVVLSVSDDPGVHTVMDELLEATKTGQRSTETRRAAVTLLCAFCSNAKVDYSQYVPQLLRGLLHLFTDEDHDVLHMSWEALNAVTKTLGPLDQSARVSDVRQAVRFAVSDLKGQELLPGFCLPKGITPVLPIFREAILNGAPEVKEQAAQGLGEVIRVTSADALKPSVVNITGPLIRILGDRFSWNVKVAVLETLALLLSKVGAMLKPFLPQLQTTFLKSLNDPNRQVRLKAAGALGHLAGIHTRADPLFTELHSGVRGSDETSIRDTMLQALRGVLLAAGDKMGDSIRRSILQTLLGMLGMSDDTTRSSAAGCVGALCKWLPEDELDVIVTDNMLDDDLTLDWTLRHGRSAVLFVAIKEAGGRVYRPEWQGKVHRVLLTYLAADRVPIALNGVRGCGYLFRHVEDNGLPYPTQLVQPFARTMNHASNEAKQVLAQVATYLAKHVPRMLRPELLKPLIPMLVNGTKEKNSMVKANSEFALVAVLRLHHGEETQQSCLELLDLGARDSLSDVLSKVLRKVAYQPEGKEDEIDDTLLT